MGLNTSIGDLYCKNANHMGDLFKGLWCDKVSCKECRLHSNVYDIVKKKEVFDLLGNKIK